MPTMSKPVYGDAALKGLLPMGDDRAVDVNNVPVSPASGNVLTKDADGLLVTPASLVSSADDNGLTVRDGKLYVNPGVSAQADNLLREGTDGRPYVSATDLLSNGEVNLLTVDPTDKRIMLSADKMSDILASEVVSDDDSILSVDEDGNIHTEICLTYDAFSSELTLTGKDGDAVCVVSVPSSASALKNVLVMDGQPSASGTATRGDYYFSWSVELDDGGWSPVFGEVVSAIRGAATTVNISENLGGTVSGSPNMRLWFDDVRVDATNVGAQPVVNFDDGTVVNLSNVTFSGSTAGGSLTFNPGIGIVAGKYLCFVWRLADDNTVRTTYVDMADFVDIYTAGTGINVSNNVVSVNQTWLNQQIENAVTERVEEGNLVTPGDGIDITVSAGKAEVSVDEEWLENKLDTLANAGELVSVTGSNGIQVTRSNKTFNVQFRNGAGLVIGSDGRVLVDFSEMDPEQITSIVYALLQPGGGLASDPSTGQIYVDFTTMPTDKFEDLLKSLDLYIWLTQNTNFYVNQATGSDTLDDGRGLSADKPFQTIQACIDYVTSTYNLDVYTLYINIAEGTYNESIHVGSFTVTTGNLYFRKNPSSTNKPKIVNTYTGNSNTQYSVDIYSGNSIYWNGIDIEHTNIPSSATNHDVIVFRITKFTTLSLYNSTFTLISNGDYNSRNAGILYSGDYSSILISYNNKLISNYTKGRVVYVMWGNNYGYLGLANIYDTETNDYLYIEGTFRTALWLQGYSTFYRSGTTDPIIEYGECHGNRYHIISCSGVDVGGAGAEYFPGDAAGYLESNTYCWYK